MTNKEKVKRLNHVLNGDLSDEDIESMSEDEAGYVADTLITELDNL